MEIIEQGETETLKTQAKANNTSSSWYKTLATMLLQFAENSNKQATEILRLQELLRKNGIQFILPVEPVKLPENTAVVPTPEPELETPPTTQS